MFRVKLSLVPEEGVLEERDLALKPVELGLSGPFSDDSVLVDYEFRRIQDKVFGKFRAQTGLALECSRCLKRFHQDVQAFFLAEFEQLPKGERSRTTPDPSDPELGAVFYEGDFLPVGEELRQELELQVPQAPLCRPDCKGLCPVCGGDLNEKDCRCSSRAKKSPFDGLEKLFRPSKEN